MRQAVNRSSRSGSSLSYSLPAPIGGLNTEDGLADMPPLDAVIMDNVFPRTSDVMLRKGFSNHATGISGVVETVMQYATGSSRILFAAAGTAVYDATLSGAVGAAVLAGRTNARWQHVNFGTAGGQFLLICNGVDTPVNYNGTTWQTTPAITGVTSANLIHVNAHKQRLFFIEKNTMNAWYLPVASIGGVAAKFDFSSLFPLGGHLMAMGTWTIDGGSGADDFAVWITSEGEVAVYAGTDPAVSANWGLVGIYRIGKPIGRRCMVKLGGDLVIITYDGIVPLSRALRGRASSEASSLSKKIRSAFSEKAVKYGVNFGWQIIQFPSINMLIVNVPASENLTAEQYIMNTITGAWCRFNGINGYSFELFNEHIYAGFSGKVIKFWDTNADAGMAIIGDAKQAFSHFGVRGRLKKFNMARPIISTDGVINPSIAINVDFENKDPTSLPTFTISQGSFWDVAPWDTSSWETELGIQKSWQSISGMGYVGAFRIKVSSSSPQIFWTSTDFLFERAAYL